MAWTTVVQISMFLRLSVVELWANMNQIDGNTIIITLIFDLSGHRAGR